LESLGFRESFASWRDRVFVSSSPDPPARLGEHADNGIKIELHEKVRERLPLRVTDISDLMFVARARAGLNPYPSKAVLMAHLLLHAAGGMAFRSLRLVNLHDIALLSARLSNSDWDEILGLVKGPQDPWWALPPLALTTVYYSSAIPERVLSALAPRCPWLLRQLSKTRRLSEVSLSFPWIKAFPGLEWARSPGEMLGYMLKRGLPDSEQLSVRRALVDTQPGLAESRWGHLSQGRRILRWVVSRPMRPATMHPVRAALMDRL
jgi:hypothetical protein